MPPPDPRSSTVSPGLSFASAVGLPQPSEASSASSGIWLICDTSYRLEVIGSQQSGPAGAPPQQLLPPVVARNAACPYFSLTTSFMSVVLTGPPICKSGQYLSVSQLYCGCSTLHRG